MSVYSDNMESIAHAYPDLAERIRHTSDDYSVKIVKSGAEPTAIVKHDGTEWLIHSRDNPRAEAKAFLATKITCDRPAIIVLSGLGLGYYLDVIHDRFKNTMVMVLVFENNLQLFRKMVENRRTMYQHVQNGERRDINMFEVPFLRFFVGIPENEIYTRLFDYLQSVNLKSFYSATFFIEHPILIRFNKDYYKQVWTDCERAFSETLSLFGNDPEDSWLGIDNMIGNIDTICRNPGVNQTKGMFNGSPAVIAATGPSLNNNIHLLPKVKGKAIFFSADASLKTFLTREEPIIPDIVTSLERNLTTCNHFRQVPEDRRHLMDDIWLGACPVVRPEVYDAWPGKKKMIVYRDFAHFKWLKVDKGLLNTGKSVTNLAFKIAEYMGCNPIILVGQDLAFAPSGESHASGADHAREGMRTSPLIQQKAKVMGNNGQMLDSLETWVGMLKRFEFDISQYKGTCINATEGGALIRGTKLMSLQEAIDTYMSVQYMISPIDRLNELLVPPSHDKINEDIATAYGEIEKGIEYFDFSISKLDEMIATMSSTFTTYRMNDEDLYMKIIQNIAMSKNEILNHPMCYFSIMHVLQSWCLGHDNRTNYIGIIYDNHEERKAAHLLLEYEFLHGLRILYNLVRSGVKNIIDGRQ